MPPEPCTKRCGSLHIYLLAIIIDILDSSAGNKQLAHLFFYEVAAVEPELVVYCVEQRLVVGELAVVRDARRDHVPAAPPRISARSSHPGDLFATILRVMTVLTDSFLALS